MTQPYSGSLATAFLTISLVSWAACGDDDVATSNASTRADAGIAGKSGGGGGSKEKGGAGGSEKPGGSGGSGGRSGSDAGGHESGSGGTSAGAEGASGKSGAGGQADAGGSGHAGSGGIRSDPAGLACFDGDTRYPTATLKNSECSQCATTNCCAEWVNCQRDVDCKCHLDCVGQGSSSERCLELCRITKDPLSDTWAQCTQNKCPKSCGVDMTTADAGVLNANGETCNGNGDCMSDNCLDAGNGARCYGNLRADSACTSEFDCRNGLCLATTPEGPGKVCVEADFTCTGAGVDPCHFALGVHFCQLHKKCTTIAESFDGCVASECVSLTSSVSASECEGILDQLEKDSSCPSSSDPMSTASAGGAGGS